MQNCNNKSLKREMKEIHKLLERKKQKSISIEATDKEIDGIMAKLAIDIDEYFNKNKKGDSNASKRQVSRNGKLSNSNGAIFMHKGNK